MNKIATPVQRQTCLNSALQHLIVGLNHTDLNDLNNVAVSNLLRIVSRECRSIKQIKNQEIA